MLTLTGLIEEYFIWYLLCLWCCVL